MDYKNFPKPVEEWIEEFYDKHPGSQILFLYQAGSHFFDLNGPNSDLDYRGVYLPTVSSNQKGMLEGGKKQFDRKTNTKSANSSEDIDFTLFSITKVFELLKKGDFNMMELLYTPENKILIDTPLMKEIRECKENYLVNDISAFLGFVKKEYTRYGVNINHFKAQEQLLKWIKNKNYPGARLTDIWNELKEYAEDEPLIKFTTSRTGGKDNWVPSIKIAQRLYQNTVKIQYVIDALEQRLTKYGHRQRNMAKTNCEYKGLYHAVRLIYEAVELCENGKLVIPLPEHQKETLRKIKFSEMEKEEVFETVDKGLVKLQGLERSTKSNRKEVSERLDKLLFALTGRLKVNKTMEKTKEFKKYQVGKPSYMGYDKGSSSWCNYFVVVNKDGSRTKIKH